MAIIRNLMHLALRVHDLDATLRFYRDGLGLPEVFSLKKREFYDMLSEEGNGVPDRSDEDAVWLTYLRIRDEQYLEIFPVPREEVSQFVDRQSVFHFSLQVDDIRETVAALQRQGVVVSPLHIDALEGRSVPTPFEPIRARCHSLIAWVKDPDGNLIELMQLMPDSLQRGLDTK
jgi:lactoylglutathione lyase